MPYQIVCLSCGYRRAWPSLADAQADGHRHHDAPCTPIQTNRDVARETESDEGPGGIG
jgi:hypothetical protein